MIETAHRPAPDEGIRDLLDFEGEALYFDEPMVPEVAALLERSRQASSGEERLEPLLQADVLAPDDLTVIVALYRYYYFAHDFEKGLGIADRAMQAAGRRLNLPTDWRVLTAADINRAGAERMAMLRFYLWALKGRAYLLMRLGRMKQAIEPLEKIVALDAGNRLNCRPLLELARERLTDSI